MDRFYSAVAAGGSLTLLTEFGDKTFFVAAILGAKFSRVTVWWGSSLALWVQTIICSVIGHLLKTIPAAHDRSLWTTIPWDHYVAGLLLIGFGLWNIHENIHENKSESEDEALRDRDLDELLQQLAIDTNEDVYTNLESPNFLMTPPKENSIPRRVSICSTRNIKAASEIIIKTQSNKAAFIQTFTTVFAAELGDRSMFSTIALAAAQDAYGVALGACMAHSVVCLAAVSCSSLLCRYISDRTLGLIAAGLFFLFGILSIFDGILKQSSP